MSPWTPLLSLCIRVALGQESVPGPDSSPELNHAGSLIAFLQVWSGSSVSFLANDMAQGFWAGAPLDYHTFPGSVRFSPGSFLGFLQSRFHFFYPRRVLTAAVPTARHPSPAVTFFWPQLSPYHVIEALKPFSRISLAGASYGLLSSPRPLVGPSTP